MKFTEEHLWLRIEDGEDEVTVGLSSYAAGELGEAKYIELPEEGDVISLDDPVVVIEGGEDAVDILAPLDGEVTEANTRLIDAPDIITDDPQGDGWLFKMSIDDADALEDFMSEAAYQKYIR
ncbi:glycine cleavage system protein H [uncultured Sulfitobacter sp.]|uniref:glycine cleavage system protein H n=1 Tax=uncultured Sulfitobacter sp. TaxID=191468 RepID=UPI002639F12B|nr:glycine cleavage system protein H [uncultured Sulfitobacter sp.]